jgi:hypothetical protein
MFQMHFKLLYITFFTCCTVINACSQVSNYSADRYVGSTPCDSLIKTSLGIPASTGCEFIKWNARLSFSSANTGTFELTALYGISQPNTNGFKGGGSKITIAGKYDTDGKGFFRLQAGQLPVMLYLIKMDDNVFHFADSNKKLLVGNGGWGYVLNRTQPNLKK